MSQVHNPSVSASRAAAPIPAVAVAPVNAPAPPIPAVAVAPVNAPAPPIPAVAVAPVNAPAPPIPAVAVAPVSNSRMGRWRALYADFDARLQFCLGEIDLTLSLLQGVLNEQEVLQELVIRFPPPEPQPLVPAGVLPPPPPPDAVDATCPGLQPPRPDGGVREIDVCSLTPEHAWNLFLKPDVGGGYLGKSVVHFLVQKNAAGFAAAYPGGKFTKAVDVEAQRICFVAHLADGAVLQAVHDFIMQKIPSLLSLRTKMRCVNVPDRLEQAAVAARAAAVAAAAEPAKATLNDNLFPPHPQPSPRCPSVTIHAGTAGLPCSSSGAKKIRSCQRFSTTTLATRGVARAEVKTMLGSGPLNFWLQWPTSSTPAKILRTSSIWTTRIRHA